MKKMQQYAALFLACMLTAGNSCNVNAAERVQQPVIQQEPAPAIDKAALVEYYMKNFDVAAYIRQNPALVAVFGDKTEDYIVHYVDCGIAEGRRTGKWDAVAFVVNNMETIWTETLAGSGDWFNAAEYRKSYPDIAAVFGNDDMVCLKHYLTCGILEGRQGGGIYDPVIFSYYFPDALVKTNCMPNQFKKAYIKEAARKSVKSSSRSSGGSSSESNNTGSSGSKPGNSDTGSKPAESDTAGKIDKYEVIFVSGGEYLSIIFDDYIYLPNPNGWSFEDTWKYHFGDSALYIIGYVKDEAVYANKAYPGDFICNREESTAALELDKNFFGKDVAYAPGIFKTLIIKYTKTDEPSKPSEPLTGEPSMEDTLICDNMSDDYRSMEICIRSDDVIRLPVTVFELLERGYYISGQELDTDVGQGEAATVYLKSGMSEDSGILIGVCNPFDEKIITKYGIVQSAVIYGGDNVLLPKGISADKASRQCIEKEYGTADAESDTLLEYHFENGDSAELNSEDKNIISFSFDGSGSLVKAELSAAVRRGDFGLKRLECAGMSTDYKSLQVCIRSGDYIQLPAALGDLLAEDYCIDDNLSDREIQSGKGTSILIYDKADRCNEVLVHVCNPYEDTINITESIVYSIYVSRGKGQDILLPKSVLLTGSSKDGILETYGPPKDNATDKFISYCWDADGAAVSYDAGTDKEFNSIIFGLNESDGSTDSIAVTALIDPADYK